MKLINIYFNLHYIGTIIVPFLWIVSPYFLILHFIILSSWYVNNNKCIISQLEYNYTGRTFIGYGKKYYVPRIHRYILYGNFIVGNFYYFIM